MSTTRISAMGMLAAIALLPERRGNAAEINIDRVLYDEPFPAYPLGRGQSAYTAPKRHSSAAKKAASKHQKKGRRANRK